MLGIDPGVARTGWAIIEGKKDIVSFQDSGCINTAKTTPFEKRLATIYQEITGLIKKYNPDTVVVEEIFFHKNAKTAIAVSQARGVIMLAAEQAKKQIKEFTPLQVKQAICGYGRADKQQVQRMIKAMLKLEKIPKSDDAADALAIAVCGLITKEY